MPALWHDHHHIRDMGEDEIKELYDKIVVTKKPYFMRYIYPALMREYNKYVGNAIKKSLREFGITIQELESMDISEYTDYQKEFLHYYRKFMPVGTGNCVMNRICRKFEDAFDGYMEKFKASNGGTFDVSIMKSGQEYPLSTFYNIKHLFDEYCDRLKTLSIFSKVEGIDEIEKNTRIDMINAEFAERCSIACPDETTLCDIILDICYNSGSLKRFAWGVCGKEIINNLLNRNNRAISCPVRADIVPGAERGELVTYCGEDYVVMTITLLEVDENDNNE